MFDMQLVNCALGLNIKFNYAVFAVLLNRGTFSASFWVKPIKRFNDALNHNSKLKYTAKTKTRFSLSWIQPAFTCTDGIVQILLF
jgi:hypothetical protein